MKRGSGFRSRKRTVLHRKRGLFMGNRVPKATSTAPTARFCIAQVRLSVYPVRLCVQDCLVSPSWRARSPAGSSRGGARPRPSRTAFQRAFHRAIPHLSRVLGWSCEGTPYASRMSVVASWPRVGQRGPGGEATRNLATGEIITMYIRVYISVHQVDRAQEPS